jgi:hypothetical protein
MPMGQALKALAVAIATSTSALVPACAFDALPTDETGNGRSEELEEALSVRDQPLPADAADILYTVHTSIDSHAVGVRFRTTTAGLQELLTSVDRSQSDLQPGVNPWEVSPRLSSHSPELYDWDLAGVTSYAGLEVESDSSLSSTGVLVDLEDPDAPVVYLEVLDCC